MRAADLFCGAGLSSAGARAAGANVVAGVDCDGLAADTYALNFPMATVLSERLEQVDPAKLRDKVGDIELLLASPECTNHTCAKGSAPRSEASRATAMQVLRYAKAFEPRWIVMENVVYMRPWSRYSELLEKLKGLKYNIQEHVLDAAQFGVAQKRKRLFVVCDREAKPQASISPMGMKPVHIGEILDRDGEWATTPLFRKGRAADTKARAKRAIAELGKDRPFLIVYYGTDGCGGWQSLDRPLRTVTTVDRFALVRSTPEGYRMRMLQVPELRRAMGAGDDFQLAGTRREQIKLLGNGVCPPVMEAVVRSLAMGS